VPIYPLTEGCRNVRCVRSSGARFEQVESQIEEPWPELSKMVGDKISRARQTPFHMLHFPMEMADTKLARQRLAFDELFALQLEIQRRRRALKRTRARCSAAARNELIQTVSPRLGFKLTNAQTRVLREIRKT